MVAICRTISRTGVHFGQDTRRVFGQRLSGVDPGLASPTVQEPGTLGGLWAGALRRKESPVQAVAWTNLPTSSTSRQSLWDGEEGSRTERATTIRLAGIIMEALASHRPPMSQITRTALAVDESASVQRTHLLHVIRRYE